MVRWLDRILCLVEDVFIVVLTLAALVMATAQVVLRYVFSTGIHWLEAALVTAVIWAMLLGASRAVREGLHPRVDLLAHIVRRPFRVVLNGLALAAALALSIVILSDSVFYAQFLQMINALHPELGINQVYPFLIVPVMATMMTVRYLLLGWAMLSDPGTLSPEGLFRAKVAGPSKTGVDAQ